MSEDSAACQNRKALNTSNAKVGKTKNLCWCRNINFRSCNRLPLFSIYSRNSIFFADSSGSSNVASCFLPQSSLHICRVSYCHGQVHYQPLSIGTIFTVESARFIMALPGLICVWFRGGVNSHQDCSKPHT